MAGSIGTYMGVQPSVRIYTIDSQLHIPLDYTIWEFNIDEANAGSPNFKQAFTMTKDFSMKDLSPTEF